MRRFLGGGETCSAACPTFLTATMVAGAGEPEWSSRLSPRSLSQIAVTATINNIRTATPTAKVKPWTSKIILENYTLKRALPARLTLRKESCARCKELLPVGHELTGDFGALAHIRGQPLLISGYRIRRRTSRTQLLR